MKQTERFLIICHHTLLYITLLLSLKGGVMCTKLKRKACLQGWIQGKQSLPLTALGFTASRAVCGAEMKWPIPHIQNPLITTLLYWPVICILVARLMWTLPFSTSTRHFLPQDCHWSVVLFFSCKPLTLWCCSHRQDITSGASGTSGHNIFSA